MTTSETLGQLVKRLRKERGLTQGQVATYANVTRSWLSLVEGDERWQPDREMLERVAVVLHVPPETLLAAAGYRITPLPIRERTPEELLREALARIEAERKEQERQRQAENTRVLILHETLSPAHAGSGSAVETQEWTYVPQPGAEQHRYFRSGDKWPVEWGHSRRRGEASVMAR